MNLPLWLDALRSALMVIGAAFMLIGSFGLAKRSDFAKRLHGPTEATTLGVGGGLVASALFCTFDHERVSLHELRVTLFLFLTAPVSAHLLIKVAMALDPRLVRPPLPADAGAREAATTGAADGADRR